MRSNRDFLAKYPPYPRCLHIKEVGDIFPYLNQRESFISVGAPKTQYECLPCAALLLNKALTAFKGIDCRAVPKLAASCRICRRHLKTGWRWRRHPGNHEVQWSGMLKHRTGKKLCAKVTVFKQHWLLIKLLRLFVFSFYKLASLWYRDNKEQSKKPMCQIVISVKLVEKHIKHSLRGLGIVGFGKEPRSHKWSFIIWYVSSL